MLLRFCPKIQTTKGSKSRFKMTHGHVSTSQTVVYPLLPPPSQSIFVLKKKQQKQNRNPEWEPPLNWREEQCKQHMYEVEQKKQNNIRQRRVKKKKDKRSLDFTRKTQKVQ